MKLIAHSATKRLKLLLVDRELDHAQLAATTGLSLSLVEKIAAGHRVPTVRTVARLENRLGARIFSTPKKYRARLQTPEPRRYTFRAGCQVEFVDDSEAAACLVAECAGRATRDGTTVTFTSDVQGTFTFPRKIDSAQTAASQQSNIVAPSPTAM